MLKVWLRNCLFSMVLFAGCIGMVDTWMNNVHHVSLYDTTAEITIQNCSHGGDCTG